MKIKRFNELNEQLDNHNIEEINDYKRGIELYKIALENIEECMTIFDNTPWGIPEELDMLFGERQGNESLYSLQKEVSHLLEDMDEDYDTEDDYEDDYEKYEKYDDDDNEFITDNEE